MKLPFRLVIAFAVCLSIGLIYSYRSVVEELRPRYLESVEEVLVDQSHILAELVSQKSSDSSINVAAIKSVVEQAQKRRFDAQIYYLNKKQISLDVYVTDLNGIVLFHSYDSNNVGRDFSKWRDVHLTLQGKYGARSSDRLYADPSSSTLYVASPIVKNGKMLGVLTVCKPTTSINYFLEIAEPKLIRSGTLIALGILALAAFVAFWINQPIARLVKYARQVKEGKKPELPKLKTPEVREMGQAILQMQQALEGKEYIEEYTHTLTHEIKSPLSSILGASELLQESIPEDKKQKFLQNIHQDGQRIQNLVDRMLELVKLENRKEKIVLEKVDLSQLLEDVLDSKEPALLAQKVSLEKDIQAGVFSKIDKFLVKQAITNVLQNALEFSSLNASISVRLQVIDDVTNLVISDQGPGVPEYALEKVFNRFFSLARPESGKKSTGLGLTFVKEVMRLHQGCISVENKHEPEKGFIVTLSFMHNS